ncbi:substrate-binding domain-containing protein [Salinisphaera sp.]|uniref:substrate-binding domain-containing protein n=1 Tax=Salinisphaera sp. TaxID=1914330 RepID=UPI002D78921E|nr:substrate-binding domain-containing protein [Salinisphaera sp.]HET7314188.1 substrate-binding domain-containing protein [Salinisphaera sp.]
MKRSIGLAVALLVAAVVFSGLASAADKPLVGLITKTNTNPYFVTMKKGAQKEAKKLGINLRTYAGRYDGDNQSQVRAIENLISAGADGILITPNDPEAIVPTIRKARDAGIFVIALDTRLNPADAADATFATNNFKAGVKIGKWARAMLGDKAKDAHIAMLDLHKNQPTVGVQRDQGFLKGFGIEINDPNFIGDENDDRIVGHDVTAGNPQGGRRAAENLLQRNHNTNVMYSINEPAAAGAYQALKSFGLTDQVLLVAIDGSCAGVRNVKAGRLDATSMQFPLRMAKKGMKAMAEYIKTGEKPVSGFVNTGTKLVTKTPVETVDSISPEKGLKLCWGQ